MGKGDPRRYCVTVGLMDYHRLECSRVQLLKKMSTMSSTRYVTSRDSRRIQGSEVERDSLIRMLPPGTLEGFKVKESSVHSK